jgi:hypothetical protein
VDHWVFAITVRNGLKIGILKNDGRTTVPTPTGATESIGQGRGKVVHHIDLDVESV